MLHSIAVTTDFSPTSRLVFPAARSLAERFGARLHVVHVAHGPEIYTPWQIVTGSPAELRRREEEAQRRLQELVASEPAFAGFRVEPRALLGDSVESLHRFQEWEELDLIIVASRGGSTSNGLTLGSFASNVTHVATCPTLVFRTHRAASFKPGPFEPKHILVPHDFSQASNHGLEVARSWARAFDASVKLLHVVEPRMSAEERFAGGGAEQAEAYFEQIRSEGISRLDELVERTDWEGIPVRTAVGVGSPYKEILGEAAASRSDLIIMASRGLSGFERLNLGSVADRTLQGASCPVLVVREKRRSRTKLIA